MVLRWSIAYLVVLMLWALLIVRRPGPTLWKGSSLSMVNGAFVAGATVNFLLLRINADNATNSPVALLIFDFALVALAIASKNTWLLLRADADMSNAVLERCFRQTRASPVLRDDRYVVQCGGCEMSVLIKPNSLGLGTFSIGLPGKSVRFAGGADSKKAQLIRDLFCKQFYRSLPTPRIKA